MNEELYWILLSKKITEEASLEELKLLEAYIDQNPALQSDVEAISEIWQSKPLQTNDNQSIELIYANHINRLKSHISDIDVFKEIETVEKVEAIENFVPQFYKRKSTFVLACALIAFLFTASIIYRDNKQLVHNSALNEVSINPGTRSQISLPDGSKVWINSGSKLSYSNNFSGKTRDVYLNGEAYFDVTKDPNKPFIVHTSGIDIKVLGTAFNVKAFDKEPTIEATLIHGSIEVVKKDEPNASTIILKPHEKLIYKKINIVQEPVVAIENKQVKTIPSDALIAPSLITITPLKKNIADSAIIETAWVYNKFSFEEERLSDLAVRLERWFNIKININSEKLSSYKLSGSFVDETLDQALTEMQLLIPFNYKVKNNEVTISPK